MKLSGETMEHNNLLFSDGFAIGDDVDAGKFLTFNLSGERYGASIEKIKEIIEYCKVTRVPLTPKEFHGVINLRGSVVPVVDLAARLGKVTNTTSKKTCIVICELLQDMNKLEIGFIVDEVEQVVDISSLHIEEAPQFGTDIRVDFIGGMGSVDDNFIILLDIDEVLSVSGLSALISVLAD